MQQCSLHLPCPFGSLALGESSCHAMRTLEQLPGGPPDEELRPPVSDPEADPPADISPGRPSHCNFPRARPAPRSHSHTPNPQESEILKLCHLKLLSFGVICYQYRAILAPTSSRAQGHEETQALSPVLGSPHTGPCPLACLLVVTSRQQLYLGNSPHGHSRAGWAAEHPTSSFWGPQRPPGSPSCLCPAAPF